MNSRRRRQSLICTSHDCRAPAAACGGGLEPDSISDNYGGSPCACSIHAIGQRLCAVDAAAQSRNLRTRRAGGQYTQPLLTLAYIFGYSPPAKSGFGKPTPRRHRDDLALPRTPARRAMLRALSASPRGAHRTGSSAALRHGARCFLLARRPDRRIGQPAENRLRTISLASPVPTGGGSVIGVRMIGVTGRLARADPAA